MAAARLTWVEDRPSIPNSASTFSTLRVETPFTYEEARAPRISRRGRTWHGTLRACGAGPDVGREDIGALFRASTAKRGEGARVVTFANGMTEREPVVSIDARGAEAVWTAEGGRYLANYNARAGVRRQRRREPRRVDRGLLPEGGAKIEPTWRQNLSLERSPLFGSVPPKAIFWHFPRM